MKKKILILIAVLLTFVNTNSFAQKTSVKKISEKSSIQKITQTKKDTFAKKIQISGNYNVINATFNQKIAKEAFTKINDLRKKNNLKPLSWNYSLENVAQIRAVELSKKFSHIRPDGSSWNSIDIKNIGGENIAQGFYNPTRLVNAWLKSEGHKRNMLNKNFKSCSMAVYVTKNKIYIAHEFSYYDNYKK